MCAATAHCPAAARLQAAGATYRGSTNAGEFSFSGVGIYANCGALVNPEDSIVERISGDTFRISAARCGIVDFKSAARLAPTTGALPMPTSLDTAYTVTRLVREASTTHGILAARTVTLPAKPQANYRFATPSALMQDSLDSAVKRAFERSVLARKAAAAQIERINLSGINELASINSTGGLAAAQSCAWRRKLIAKHQND